MSDTTFVAGTPIVKGWLNDVNDNTYTTVAPASGTFRDAIGEISVKESRYGAVGDGVTNDATALNAAFAASATNVIIPSGTYLISSAVTVPSGVNIIGKGTVVIKSSGTGDFVVTGNSLIEGIKFDLNSTSRQVYGEGADNMIFRRCEFTGSTNNGLFMYEGPQNLLVDSCKGYSNTKAGFYVAGSTTNAPTNIEFRSCFAYSNGDGGGISVAGVGERTSPAQTALYAKHVRIINCVTYSNGVAANSGLDLPYIDGLTVSGCHSYSNLEHGIALQETKNFAISGNFLYNNSQANICCQSGFDPYRHTQIGTISGNILTGAGSVGLWFKEQCSNITVTGNVIINNTSHNVRFSDLAASGLKANDIVFVNNIFVPQTGASVTNSNSSTNISFYPNLNHFGDAIAPNAMTTYETNSTTTLDTSGPTDNYPELFVLTWTGTRTNRTAIAEAGKLSTGSWRRITIMADGSGGVEIGHNQGNGTTLAGFLLQGGATITLGAWEAITFVGNGTNWVQISQNY